MSAGPAPDLLERLRAADTCAVSDALDSLGLPGAVTGLAPMWPDRRVTAGRARTVRAAAAAAAGPSTHIATPLVAIAEPGDVIVIDNAARVDVSCWGGLLAQAARQRDVAGVVVDGACRDVLACEDLSLPLYARAAVPVSARGRIVQAAMDVPVRIGGVLVRSGDWVIADRNGVAFVPAELAAEVIALAERLIERERLMDVALRAGRSVIDVMHDTQFSLASFTPDRPPAEPAPGIAAGGQPAGGWRA